MTAELHLLVNVAVAVAVALVGGLLAHALRQPVIVGYLLAGIAIGPFTPGFIGDREQIAALAEVGVIFLMFALGIEFSLAELARVRGVALVGTALQVLLTVGAGLGLGLLQIGEFSYLLAQTGRGVGALSDELNSLILTSSVVTIILTPPAFRLAPAVGRGLDRLPLLGRHLGVPTSAPDEQSLLAGHAVVVGHGRVGGAVASQLQRAGLPVAVVEADLHVVRRLRAAGIPAVYGEPPSAPTRRRASPAPPARSTPSTIASRMWRPRSNG